MLRPVVFPVEAFRPSAPDPKEQRQPMAKKPVTYAGAGVSIEKGDRLVDFLREKNPAIGGFSGLVPFDGRGMKKPMLVASTDGVGTKLLLAKQAGDCSTIGIDLVAMVINDLLVCGARPLFFLDYYASGKLDLKQAKAVIQGILAGCEIAKCPLIGGETAELPGLYRDGDFDLAGFGIGVVDGAKAIDGSKIKTGDLVFGFESSGIHSNGYSLARQVLTEGPDALPLNAKVKELGMSLKKALLQPTKIYTALTEALAASGARIKGYAHITGGGIPGNLNRVLPKDVDAVVDTAAWTPHPLFAMIEARGPVQKDEMFRTFNMGLGFMAVAGKKDKETILAAAAQAGEKAHVVGRIVEGTGVVQLN